jgi:hypothetical protein
LILLAQVAPAQSQDPTFLDNHYLVYLVGGVPYRISVPGPITLDDQWGSSEHAEVFLEYFANPVDKNGEGIIDESLHQTWWLIDDPQPGRRVQIENQFGRQTWFVKDGKYLVLPAAKDATAPLPPGTGQHYKCYDAQGSGLDLQVTLQDQWGAMTGSVARPQYFCNPTFKTFEGVTTPTLNDSLHMACYKIEPPMMLEQAFLAWDQFGMWEPLVAAQTEWLCVPTAKLSFIAVQEETWGNIKKLYR